MLFIDNASPSHRVCDVNMCHRQSGPDLGKMTSWAHQWKMPFNTGVNKQAVEVIFSQKRWKPQNSIVSFNNVPVKRDCEAKHLGVILDEKLNIRRHISG